MLSSLANIIILISIHHLPNFLKKFKMLFYMEWNEKKLNFATKKVVVFKSHTFEGVIHNMERRYRETESNGARRLSEILKVCADCQDSFTQAHEMYLLKIKIYQNYDLPIEQSYNFLKIKIKGGVVKLLKRF